MKTDLVTTSDVRKLINDIFALDSDLDAFCIDHYPHTFKYFTNGMNRVDKVNLLLRINSTASLIEQLQCLQSSELVAIHAPPTHHGVCTTTQHPVPASSLDANEDSRLERSKSISESLTKVTSVIIAIGIIATGIIFLLREKHGAPQTKTATSSQPAPMAVPGAVTPTKLDATIADPKLALTKSWRINKVMVPATQDLISISGTSSRDIWIVGLKNTVMHFNGERWIAVNPEHENPRWSGDWKGVWSQSPEDVWIVGSSGNIRHFDGNRWSAYESHTDRPLWRVWARSAEDVWAVGNSGVIRRFNGNRWLPVRSGTENNLLTLWGNQESVWMVGREGMILQCANDCEPEAMQKGTWIRGIFGFVTEGKTSLWAVGNDGLILRREAGIWNQIESVTNNHLLRIWGSSASDLWAVGSNGTVIHWDGQSWVSIPTGTDEAFSGVWGSDQNNVWLIGTNSTVMRYRGE